MILNTEYIRRRRRDLRLSQRAVAKQLGVTSQVIAALEEGTNHPALPLGFVSSLAELLAVEVVDLYARKIRADCGQGELAAQIGAFLVDAGTLVAAEALAEAFQVSLDEVDEALDQLSVAAGAAGLALQRKTGGDVALYPNTPVDSAARQRLVRRHQARRGLSLTEARVLYRLLHGEVDEGKLSNSDSVALNRLRHAGIATDHVMAELTGDAKVSMLLGGTPGT